MSRDAEAPGGRFGRVAVIGVGLIGGSFALALKAARACGQVVGVGRSRANLDAALALGAIDVAESDVARAVRGADLILVATPVAQFGSVFSALAPALSPGALMIDAGSTKRDVVAAAHTHLGAKVAQFVPTHPIAGAEHSGVAAAKADLFRGKRVVLVPLPENAAESIARATGAWQACGARVARMAPEEHDAVFAAVSHLPHLLAFANSAQLFGYAAGGFRDFTRIASSHPEMWRDICVANHDALLAELKRYGEQLESIRALLAAGDAVGLEEVFAQARAARNRWLGGEFDF
jgi:prephenate dehydrogenase